MASTFTTIRGYALTAPTDNATVNAVVKELYLEGNEAVISSLLANKASIIVKHKPTDTTDQLFIGVATNAGWTAQSVLCACQFDPIAAREALVLPMVPQNNSGVHGYMVLEFTVETNGNTLQWHEISIYQRNVELSPAVIQRQCWPIIADWLENDYIYVDPADGKDYYSGTETFPVASISRAMDMSKRIKLKRGQKYYSNLVLDGYVIDAYGDGNLPELCGMITPAKSLNWERGYVENNVWKKGESGNVWRLDLHEANAFKGFVPRNNYEFNIGTIVNMQTGQTLNCRKCFSLDSLTNDYDIYQEFSPNTSSVFRYLYLCLKSGEPDKENWALTAGVNGIQMKNSTVRNVAIRYWGKHGIAVGSNSLIDSCEVDCIGGSQMSASSVSGSCAYGNGIEVWIHPGSTVQNVTVQNCRITRCYDAGLTFQGEYNAVQALPNAINFLFADNYVSNCGYGLEIWDTPKDRVSYSGGVLRNCRISNCTFAFGGYNTGFQQMEPNNGLRLNCLINNGFRKKVDCTIDSCNFEYGTIFVRQKALVNGTLETVGDVSFTIDAETITLKNNKITMQADDALMYIHFSDRHIIPANATGVARYRQADADTTSTISIIDDNGTVEVFGPIFK